MLTTRSIVAVVTVFSSISTAVSAADWPTFRGDNSRTGSTAEKLTLPLKERWVYAAPAAPEMA